MYGKVRELTGEQDFIPFRFLGQYHDLETRLYYNRFRYYDPEMGMYTQQNPIGLARNNPTFQGYVGDVNKLVDPCLYLLNIKNILILFLPKNHDVIKDILDNPDNIF
ncbi:RHS repeat-associated core domain-containing protein [Lysinibacillus sp. G4S2]|uniref:RHS repeat domain-containing protein n=1 Tax=Lysinibacillus sp. G4S2 TaxID=3055859 RepID=UPI0025A24516|nr:RHS repeat-associated core domain-containing protein [Lysinibacillus sp. G4S2]